MKEERSKNSKYGMINKTTTAVIKPYNSTHTHTERARTHTQTHKTAETHRSSTVHTGTHNFSSHSLNNPTPFVHPQQ